MYFKISLISPNLHFVFCISEVVLPSTGIQAFSVAFRNLSHCILLCLSQIACLPLCHSDISAVLDEPVIPEAVKATAPNLDKGVFVLVFSLIS